MALTHGEFFDPDRWSPLFLPPDYSPDDFLATVTIHGGNCGPHFLSACHGDASWARTGRGQGRAANPANHSRTFSRFEKK